MGVDEHEGPQRARREPQRDSCITVMAVATIAMVVGLGATAAVVALLWQDWDLGLELGSDATCEGTDAPLHAAAYRGDGEEVRRLLGAGTDPDARAPDTLFALECAIAGGHDGVVEVLLAAGADPDEGLWSAVDHGDGEALRRLLDAGADPDRVEPDGEPVVRTAMCGDAPPALARTLLDAGGTPVALGCALDRADPGLVDDLLARGVEVEPLDVVRVVESGDAALAVRLLDAGGDPDLAFGAALCGPLVAPPAGDPVTTSGAPPGACTDPGRTAARLEIAAAALGAGAGAGRAIPFAGPALATSMPDDVDLGSMAEDASRLPGDRDASIGLLALAAAHGDDAVVGLLLDRGADLDAGSVPGLVTWMALADPAVEVDPAGSAGDESVSPLLAAATLGRTSTVELLLDRGADPDGPAGASIRPVDIARARGHLAIVDRLLAAGAAP